MPVPVRGHSAGSSAEIEGRVEHQNRYQRRRNHSTYVLQPLVVQRLVVALQQVILVVRLLQRLRLRCGRNVIDIMTLQCAAAGRDAAHAAAHAASAAL